MPHTAKWNKTKFSTLWLNCNNKKKKKWCGKKMFSRLNFYKKFKFFNKISSHLKHKCNPWERTTSGIRFFFFYVSQKVISNSVRQSHWKGKHESHDLIHESHAYPCQKCHPTELMIKFNFGQKIFIVLRWAEWLP